MEVHFDLLQTVYHALCLQETIGHDNSPAWAETQEPHHPVPRPPHMIHCIPRQNPMKGLYSVQNELDLGFEIALDSGRGYLIAES